MAAKTNKSGAKKSFQTGDNDERSSEKERRNAERKVRKEKIKNRRGAYEKTKGTPKEPIYAGREGKSIKNPQPQITSNSKNLVAENR